MGARAAGAGGGAACARAIVSGVAAAGPAMGFSESASSMSPINESRLPTSIIGPGPALGFAATGAGFGGGAAGFGAGGGIGGGAAFAGAGGGTIPGAVSL